MARWTIMLLLFALTSLTGLLQGRAASPKIVVAASDGDPIAKRVEAELGALGFDVVRVEVPQGHVALEEAATREGAIAAIRVTPSGKGPSGNGVEVWIVDRVTGKTVLREVVPSASMSPADVAVRVVELLRASLMEVDAPHPSRGAVPPPPEIDRMIPPRDHVAASSERKPPTLSVSLGPAVLVSPGGFGSSVDAALAVRLSPTRNLGVMMQAWLPVAQRTIARTEGTADVHGTMVFAGFQLRLAPEARWSPELGMGSGIAYMRVAGSGRGPNTGINDSVVAALAYVQGGLVYAIAPQLRARFDALIGLAIPQPVIRMAGREVASFGRPFGGGALAIEVAWP